VWLLEAGHEAFEQCIGDWEGSVRVNPFAPCSESLTQPLWADFEVDEFPTPAGFDHEALVPVSGRAVPEAAVHDDVSSGTDEFGEPFQQHSLSVGRVLLVHRRGVVDSVAPAA